jgi:Tfp pilus assembly protein PilX
MRLSSIRALLFRLGPGEDGYTMIAVIGAVAMISLLLTAAVAATNQDQHMVLRDLDQKRAYQAAQAGIADYTYHLNNDNGYWARCTSVPPPNGLNLAPSTTNRRVVPGSTDGSKYAIELIPATGQAACSSSNPTVTMLESSGPNIGTFRIRSTGYSGTAKSSIVATYKQATFLDYVYFTQYETSDPVTYGFGATSPELAAAYAQCTKFRRDGRPRAGTVTPSSLCDTIVFVAGDHIDGPLHTNDDICINPGDTPSFGRNAADVIEVSAPPTGYYSSSSSSGNGCTGAAGKPSPGTFATNAPVLTPPSTNTSLRTFAGPSYTFTGQTKIALSGNTMSINGGPAVAFPSDGVVYVQNGIGCSTIYSPFTATYPASSACGNAVVHGSYSGQLTIAAENDIVVDNDITNSGGGLLGLVANNFVRVAHPFCATSNCGDGSTTAETGKGACGTGVNGTSGNAGTPVTNTDVRIDAAILAIDHSFIVDHYDCGAKLITLQVNGAIAQKYRGAVGTVGSTGHGYVKDYNYDDRLRYQEPPHFFDPVQSAWHVQRETLDFP